MLKNALQLIDSFHHPTSRQHAEPRGKNFNPKLAFLRVCKLWLSRFNHLVIPVMKLENNIGVNWHAVGHLVSSLKNA